MQRAEAVVLRTTDWSETSRIATLWTREFGKVGAVAKGGRRLRSPFESALDLLNVCSIVLLRKSSGSLDLLTEARVARRFPRLRADLGALYAGYYVAELLADGTVEDDPHPALFDEVVSALEDIGGVEPSAIPTGLRVMRFELAFLRETGYSPLLGQCARCKTDFQGREKGLVFSAEEGGVLCLACQTGRREQRPLSESAWHLLRALAAPGEEWRGPWPEPCRAEVRLVLGGFITWLRGRKPRLLPYLSG